MKINNNDEVGFFCHSRGIFLDMRLFKQNITFRDYGDDISIGRKKHTLIQDSHYPVICSVIKYPINYYYALSIV